MDLHPLGLMFSETGHGQAIASLVVPKIERFDGLPVVALSIETVAQFTISQN